MDFDEIIADAINRQKEKARKDKLAGAWVAPWSAAARKLRERAQSFVDAERDAAGSFRAVLVLGVIANVRQVCGRRVPSSGSASAPVSGSQTLARLAEKPLIVVHEALHSLLHKRVGVATALSGKPGKPG
jgi:hypothetical protein